MNYPKAKTLSLLLLAVAAGAIAPALADTPAPTPDPTIAVVNGAPISRESVVEPLLQAQGLNFLLLTVQLQVARQQAARQGIVITPQDVEAERNLTVKGLFPNAEPKDYESLVDQLLAKQGISRPQFDLIVETNTCLRKIVEPMCAGKVTEENIKQAFDLQYGAKVQIRDIKVNDMAAAQAAKQRLARGEPFEKVAHEMSTDAQTAGVGGLWPPFGTATQGVAPLIRDQAWGLKPGEVSDVINTEGAYHIIKVEKRIPPPVKIVKLDQATHDYLQHELTARIVQGQMNVLRAQIAQEVIQPGVLEIRDPALKRQFDQKVAEAKRLEEERKQSNMSNLLNRLRPAASQPTTLPALPPSTEARDRPPATKSGE